MSKHACSSHTHMHKQITVKGVTCQVLPRDVVSAQDTLGWPSCSKVRQLVASEAVTAYCSCSGRQDATINLPELQESAAQVRCRCWVACSQEAAGARSELAPYSCTDVPASQQQG